MTASSLQRRIKGLEAATAAREPGRGIAPLTVELWTDEDEAAALEAAKAARVGRPILPLNGIDTVIVIKDRY